MGAKLALAAAGVLGGIYLYTKYGPRRHRRRWVRRGLLVGQQVALPLELAAAGPPGAVVEESSARRRGGTGLHDRDARPGPQHGADLSRVGWGSDSLGVVCRSEAEVTAVQRAVDTGAPPRDRPPPPPQPGGTRSHGITRVEKPRHLRVPHQLPSCTGAPACHNSGIFSGAVAGHDPRRHGVLACARALLGLIFHDDGAAVDRRPRHTASRDANPTARSIQTATTICPTPSARALPGARHCSPNVAARLLRQWPGAAVATPAGSARVFRRRGDQRVVVKYSSARSPRAASRARRGREPGTLRNDVAVTSRVRHRIHHSHHHPGPTARWHG